MNDIKRWEPKKEKRWEHDGSGGFHAEIYTDQGIVSFFTYIGDLKHRAFTNMQLWIAPHMYHVTLPRHYKDGWAKRLARQFAWDCQQMAEGKENASNV